MVVILRDAALVFWMEYRRYVRTRRYWVLALTTLALGILLCLTAALVAARIPEAPLRFLGALVYLPAAIVGWFAAIASVVHSPLSVRMLQDVYKTRPLTDLYLTELHPLGVVLGARSGDDRAHRANAVDGDTCRVVATACYGRAVLGLGSNCSACRRQLPFRK
jgi:hypothetical protein